MASDTAVLETLGIVRPDGTLVLDQKLTVPPGRVKVRVEPIETDRCFPPGYFDLIGSVDDETFIIHPQPPMQPPVEFE